MSKTYLYISLVIVAALVVVGGWGLMGTKSPTVLSDAVMPTINTVTLHDDGFDPPSLTIQAGTAVKWVNGASAANASVNSDNFPTNRLFPELNLGKFMKNQTLIHIFKNAGIYTYHDQFHPEFTGKIVVE